MSATDVAESIIRPHDEDLKNSHSDDEYVEASGYERSPASLTVRSGSESTNRKIDASRLVIHSKCPRSWLGGNRLHERVFIWGVLVEN